MPEAVVVAAVRSPIGRAFKGSLTQMRADEMASQMICAALDMVPSLNADEIDDLYLGSGRWGGESGFNLARIVAVNAGLDRLPGVTVNRNCASSLQTTRMAFHAIRAGEGEVFLSAGVESVSRASIGLVPDISFTDSPRYEAARQRTADRSGGNAPVWTDPRADGLLPDVYIAMGQTAENVAQYCGISREDQDEFALRSQQRAAQAADDGFFEREITPLTLPDGSSFCHDEGVRPGTTLEGLRSLRPAFRPDGTVTAGNACGLNDGAAAVVIMSDVKARALRLEPIARIIATSATGVSPEIMGLGPVEASRQVLARAGMTMRDIDLVEINEAFASQVLASAVELGIDMDAQLNVHGGGIALGHPFGMTGARILTTLINGLQSRDMTLGLETMCIGGGQGMAMIIERLN